MNGPGLPDKSPGRPWWWSGGILMVIGAVVAVIGFAAPFLQMDEFFGQIEPGVEPDPEAIGDIAGVVFGGVAGVFGGILVGGIGLVLVIVGFVKHSSWRREVTQGFQNVHWQAPGQQVPGQQASGQQAGGQPPPPGAPPQQTSWPSGDDGPPPPPSA